ncbi:hypothetical protein ACFQZI_02325 [Mucilaginibacter lutimaris]|uniref:Uncharacterized protein n=1 Tax=Mucilaginibacter lutimaris TaxID=931629 RepID=A0ABW2ZA32_9SPHI
MKNVLGGGLPPDPTQPGPHPCVNYVSCGVTSDPLSEIIAFYGICCDSLADSQTYCRSHGYTGVYGCTSGLAD